jgi:hypothetical protein
LGEYFFDNGDFGWAWFDFGNGGVYKVDREDFGAWQVLGFGSLIKIKILSPVPIFRVFWMVWA